MNEETQEKRYICPFSHREGTDKLCPAKHDTAKWNCPLATVEGECAILKIAENIPARIETVTN
jgi:hypothetical protein